MTHTESSSIIVDERHAAWAPNGVGAVAPAGDELRLRAMSPSVRPSTFARRILAVGGPTPLVEVETDGAAVMTGAGSALASWVAVRPLTRIDRPGDEAPARGARDAAEIVPADETDDDSSVDEGPLADCMPAVDRRRGT